MAGSVNKVILVGNLGKDPEIKTTQSGTKFAVFSIATSERWRDRDGERKEKTEWHNCQVWIEGLVKVADQYLRKGAKVYVEGKLQTRKWEDQDGKDRYSTDIHVNALTMLDSANGDGGSRGGDRDDERGGRSRDDDRGGRSRDRDDDRGGRSSSRDDDRGGGRRSRDDDDRGGRSRDRDDDRGGGRSSSRSSSRNADLDDDIPF